jgi:hypothetical protein
MKAVRFPLIVLIVLAISMLSACRHHHEGRFPVTPHPPTLKIIFNGPFAIMLKKNDPSRIIAFTPRDPKNVHEFYINDLEQSQDKKKNYFIKVTSDGLKPASTSPAIDPYLADFTAKTDLWSREEYFVTIELPVPDTITFAPPMKQVTFEDGTTGYMSTNYVLEYRVAGPSRIRAVSPGLKDLRPLSPSTLLKQFEALCGGEWHDRFHDSCIEMRNLLAQCSGANTSVLFFGVGIPVTQHIKMSKDEAEDHAVTFFNDVLLRSFPHLAGKRLRSTTTPAPGRGDSPHAMLVPAVFRGPSTGFRLLPVSGYSAVIDCKAGGIIVHVTQ